MATQSRSSVVSSRSLTVSVSPPASGRARSDGRWIAELQFGASCESGKERLADHRPPPPRPLAGELGVSGQERSDQALDLSAGGGEPRRGGKAGGARPG